MVAPCHVSLLPAAQSGITFKAGTCFPGPNLTSQPPQVQQGHVHSTVLSTHRWPPGPATPQADTMSSSTFLLSQLLSRPGGARKLPSSLHFTCVCWAPSLPPSASCQQCRVAAAEWLITQDQFFSEESQPEQRDGSFSWLGMNALIWGH